MKKDVMDLIIYGVPQEDLAEFMLDISDEGHLPFHINYIERIVRGSEAYNIWRKWNIAHEDANIDAIEGLDIKQLSKTKLELHHIITLYDIVYIVAVRILKEKGKTDPYEIAKEVLSEHLNGIIPYIPLLITDHQKYHDGILTIPKDQIKGNIEEFIKKYKKYLTEEQLNKLK